MDKILDVFELYADTDSRKINAFNSKLSSKMTVRVETDRTKQQELWVEKMEDTIEYLDNILRNPMRLIINEEEVVKIEKIKKVTVEAIKHLSKNAGFIEDVTEEGDVQPGKMLNVFKEETFNTYENRFIYTLIQRMLFIIRQQKKKILEDNIGKQNPNLMNLALENLMLYLSEIYPRKVKEREYGFIAYCIHLYSLKMYGEDDEKLTLIYNIDNHKQDEILNLLQTACSI